MARADREATKILQRVTPDTVHEVWERAQARRTDDPNGAITLARTLLETVCKHILNVRGVTYNDGDELPRLYRLTADAFQIAPNTETEDAFRRIFGACTSIVETLGTIRNRLGNAHGRGADAVRVESRYARLVVNLSGAMATFLVETLEAAQT
ncbi:MAG: abortive infection family protein [Acidobacteria bacterium]|nr:abortive infection family protein [Acidobacteriota bacterium]